MDNRQTMEKFYQNFMEEVLFAADRETSGWTTEDLSPCGKWMYDMLREWNLGIE